MKNTAAILRFDTHKAAAFLGFSYTTVKISRVTGTLAGVDAPVYRKVGRKVLYDCEVLQQWLSQFENQANTAVSLDIDGEAKQ